MANSIRSAPASSTSVLSNRILSVRQASSLTSSEKLIARCLLDFIGNNAAGWPSIRRLMIESSLSVSSVKRALKALSTKGFIKIESRNRRDGSRTSNLYTWKDKLKPSTEYLRPGQHEPRSVQRGPAFHKVTKEKPKKACCLDESAKKRFIKLEERPEEFKKHSSCKKACDDAIRIGFLRDCDSDRLVFFTAYAAVCRRLAANKVRSPARLLRFLLENRKMLVEFGTQEDEDSARTAMRKLSTQTFTHVLNNSDNTDCRDARIQ